MNIPVTVKNAKARKVPMTTKKCGGGARSAKEPAEGKVFRTKIVLAPTVEHGRKLIHMLGWTSGNVAIVTDPEHLNDVVFYPGEEVYLVLGSDANYTDKFNIVTSMFIPGESFNLKVYAL